MLCYPFNTVNESINNYYVPLDIVRFKFLNFHRKNGYGETGPTVTASFRGFPRGRTISVNHDRGMRWTESAQTRTLGFVRSVQTFGKRQNVDYKIEKKPMHLSTWKPENLSTWQCSNGVTSGRSMAKDEG